MITPADRDDQVYVDPEVGVQTPTNRFGTPKVLKRIRNILLVNDDGYIDDDEEELVSEDDDLTTFGEAASDLGSPEADAQQEPEVGARRLEIPRFARLRMNLTALSQEYDLYFVAYLDSIHVHRPQSVPQVLRETPLLVLTPKPSELALQCPPHVSTTAHQINNMMVGKLGDLEILLVVFDDGDLVAYYTHEIAQRIYRKRRQPCTGGLSTAQQSPEAFFHVGLSISSWGLAIHAKSRLIAASSNGGYVTVFAFAITSNGELRPCNPSVRGAVWNSPELTLGLSADKLEEHLRSRTRDWRILLALPHSVRTNLPSISFMDDDYGDGDKVAAIDIYGRCFVFDIWKLGESVFQLEPRSRLPRPGWGMMALPDEIFRTVTRGADFVGSTVDGLQLAAGSAADSAYIIRSTADVIPNPDDYLVSNEQGHHQITMPDVFHRAWDSDDEGKDSSRLGFEEPKCRISERLKRVRTANDDHIDRPEMEVIDIQSTFPMTILPACAAVFRDENYSAAIFRRDVLMAAYSRKHVNIDVLANEQAIAGVSGLNFAQRYSLLRTDQTGFQLLNLRPGRRHTYAPNLLNPPRQTIDTPWDMSDSRRVCMMHCIPELSLVVVGSTCGRVAVVRLTKVHHESSLHHSMRVDALLPRPEEEKAQKRPGVWMVGMAVSPVQQPESRGANMFKGEERVLIRKRWRLMLHFMDHTVLTYTIEESKPDVSRVGCEAS